ncbi:DUF6470 family protein [Paenibacillus sacheonensis]|uniref:Uncharacterized protein n=1 Tax=Paenibacillus sacheonensis TaxID=742054 RepID=A0A7X4YX35_9BACL|nr:DUF6470 family protein [Paenibacillus sacheonensis]MBM7566478.1 hypothetical protein [Paenibacillus sacheonensis]NBC73161.1 hypothetical protein [Paenibacillus sacheonensis]
MRLPQLQITSQRAVLGIQTEWGTRTIHSPRAEVQVSTDRPPIEIQSYRPVMSIDQSATWDAIIGPKPEQLAQRLVSQTTSYVQQHIQSVNAKWRNIADLAHNKENPIPNLAYAEITRDRPALPVYGSPSRMNTRVQFDVRKPDIETKPWKVHIDVQPHQEPDIQFTPGKVRYTMEQYPKVTVTPPPIVDLMV